MTRQTDQRSTPVSIVIPVFERIDLTRRCLSALRRHTADHEHEIIVVDDGSTDGTADELRELQDEGRLRAVVSGSNEGFAAACNRGAAAARHPYVLFLNNDTEVTEGWLDPLVATLDRDADVTAAAPKLLFPDGTIQHAGVCLIREDLPEGQSLSAQHLCYGKAADFPTANRPQIMRCLSGSCLLVRADDFRRVGGFDAGFRNGYEDVDLCLKLSAEGRALVYRPESVVVHYEGQSGAAADRPLHENAARLNERWLGRIEPDYYVGVDKVFTPAPSFSIRTYADPRLRFPESAPSGADAPTASVVVLTHNALDATRLCVDALLKHTDERHELVFVDNASTDGTREYLRELSLACARCHVLFNESNLGYAAGNNVGLSYARGEFVTLLNCDVVVTEGWLETLLEAAVQHPQAGLVGPMTNSINGPQKLPSVSYDQDSLEGLDDFARGLAKASRGNDELVLWLTGFCMLIRREVIARIGGLDERFGRGTFEDNDYSLRNFLAGYQALIATDCFVHHFGARSFLAEGVDYGAELEAKWRVFKDKWSIPAATPYGGDIGLTDILLRGYDPVLHCEPLPASPSIEPIAPRADEFAAVMERGESAFAQGRFEEAETFFRWLLHWRPDHGRAANNLAVALWSKGEPERALPILEDLLRRDPDDGDAAWNLREIRKSLQAVDAAALVDESIEEPTPTA